MAYVNSKAKLTTNDDVIADQIRQISRCLGESRCAAGSDGTDQKGNIKPDRLAGDICRRTLFSIAAWVLQLQQWQPIFCRQSVTVSDSYHRRRRRNAHSGNARKALSSATARSCATRVRRSGHYNAFVTACCWRACAIMDVNVTSRSPNKGAALPSHRPP